MSIPTHSDYHSQNISDSNLDPDQDQHLDPTFSANWTMLLAPTLLRPRPVPGLKNLAP